MSRRRTGQHTSAPRGSESNKNVLIATNGLIKSRIGQHHNLGGLGLLQPRPEAGLARNELAQALQIPSTAIVLWLITLAIKPFERGEALYTKSLA